MASATSPSKPQHKQKNSTFLPAISSFPLLTPICSERAAEHSLLVGGNTHAARQGLQSFADLPCLAPVALVQSGQARCQLVLRAQDTYTPHGQPTFTVPFPSAHGASQSPAPTCGGSTTTCGQHVTKPQLLRAMAAPPPAAAAPGQCSKSPPAASVSLRSLSCLLSTNVTGSSHGSGRGQQGSNGSGVGSRAAVATALSEELPPHMASGPSLIRMIMRTGSARVQPIVRNSPESCKASHAAGAPGLAATTSSSRSLGDTVVNEARPASRLMHQTSRNAVHPVHSHGEASKPGTAGAGNVIRVLASANHASGSTSQQLPRNTSSTKPPGVADSVEDFAHQIHAPSKTVAASFTVRQASVKVSATVSIKSSCTAQAKRVIQQAKSLFGLVRK